MSRLDSGFVDTIGSRSHSPGRINHTGIEDMNVRLFPGRPFKPCYLRCRFFVPYQSSAPSLPTFSDLVIQFDAGAGDQYDAVLYTINQRGYGRDVHLVMTAEELSEPSPWSFLSDDALILTWGNPDEIGWGLQIGVA